MQPVEQQHSGKENRARLELVVRPRHERSSPTSWSIHAFVIETGSRLPPIEVEAAASPGYSDTRSLRTFREEYPDRFIGGLLLDGGAQTQWVSDRGLAVPWWRVL